MMIWLWIRAYFSARPMSCHRRVRAGHGWAPGKSARTTDRGAPDPWTSSRCCRRRRRRSSSSATLRVSPVSACPSGSCFEADAAAAAAGEDGQTMVWERLLVALVSAAAGAGGGLVGYWLEGGGATAFGNRFFP